MKVAVEVSGCDDQTYVVLDVSPGEAAFLQQLAARVTETSEYGCQPRMTVTPLPEQEEKPPGVWYS